MKYQSLFTLSFAVSALAAPIANLQAERDGNFDIPLPVVGKFSQRILTMVKWQMWQLS